MYNGVRQFGKTEIYLLKYLSIYNVINVYCLGQIKKLLT